MKRIPCSKALTVSIICVALIGVIFTLGVFALKSAHASEPTQERTVSRMELIYDENQMIYLPEFPDAEYSAGVRIHFSDSSEEIPFASWVKWDSDNPDVLWVNTNGAIHPTGVGTANVTAEYMGHRVTQMVTVGEGRILSITPEDDERIVPAARSVSLDIPVYACASNGMMFEITDPCELEWSSGGRTVTQSSVNDIGNTPLTVSAYGHSAQVDLVVVDPQNATLSVSEESMSLIPNEAGLLSVMAVLDTHTFDVTDMVEWSVSDESVVQAMDGFVFAGEYGEAEITVSYGNQSITIPVEVVPAPPNYEPPSFG